MNVRVGPRMPRDDFQLSTEKGKKVARFTTHRSRFFDRASAAPSVVVSRGNIWFRGNRAKLARFSLDGYR